MFNVRYIPNEKESPTESASRLVLVGEPYHTPRAAKHFIRKNWERFDHRGMAIMQVNKDGSETVHKLFKSSL